MQPRSNRTHEKPAWRTAAPAAMPHGPAPITTTSRVESDMGSETPRDAPSFRPGAHGAALLREADRRLLRMGPVERHRAADGLHDLDPGRALDDPVRRLARVLRRSLQHLHFQQLSVVEGLVQVAEDRVGDAVHPDLEDRLEM